MDNQELTQKYLKGFNSGYILREHKPDLAKSLEQTKFPETEQEYSSGLKDGIKQRDLEIIKEKNNHKQLSKDKGFDMER